MLKPYIRAAAHNPFIITGANYPYSNVPIKLMAFDAFINKYTNARYSLFSDYL